MKSKLQRLQEAYYRANKLYQHEVAIGSDRSLIASRKRKRAWIAFNKAVRAIGDRSEVA
jgi:hypothetical protein